MLQQYCSTFPVKYYIFNTFMNLKQGVCQERHTNLTECWQSLIYCLLRHIALLEKHKRLLFLV